jgi:hypothetical protein
MLHQQSVEKSPILVADLGTYFQHEMADSTVNLCREWMLIESKVP